MNPFIWLLVMLLGLAAVAPAAPPTESIPGRYVAKDKDHRVGGTLYNPEDGGTHEAKLWLEVESHLVMQGRPKVAVLGGILGALFGRIAYSREPKS